MCFNYKAMEVTGKIIDVVNRSFINGKLIIKNGMISKIEKVNFDCDNFILPGLIDSHIHIESSMLTPSRFAKIAVSCGTVAVVSDPHEIANVVGLKGVEFMLEDASSVPFKFFFGVPSCVPATEFETSGSSLKHHEVDQLLARSDMWFLSEMMNFPGVLYEDKEVISKLKSAKKHNKPIDGHAPGLSGKDLEKYISYNISTDHECFTLDEAKEKIQKGMSIQLREGSAAKNFESLFSLIQSDTDNVMLCTDDSHPNDLIGLGHIDKIIRMGLKKGLSIFDLVTTCVINPIKHYKLPVGQLRQNDPADFIVLESLDDFKINETYINGQIVYSKDEVKIPLIKSKPVNKYFINSIKEGDLEVISTKTDAVVNVIEVVNNQIVTESFKWQTNRSNDQLIEVDIEEDILKIVVLNRYKNSKPSVGYVKGFGLKQGALAGTIAHDSHNIIAIGTSDKELCRVINCLNDLQGGLVVSDEHTIKSLPLPYGGIMTDEDGESVAKNYESLESKVIELGSCLDSPFMTMSFLSLLVIPELKIGDKGLFDVNQFKFINLIE